jgi:DNA-directed RNA polymerase specialized sigma24 family protein
MRLAARITDPDTAGDVVNDAIGNFVARRQYLRAGKLGNYFLTIVERLAFAEVRARRRRPTPMDPASLELADAYARMAERGHRVGPHSTKAR